MLTHNARNYTVSRDFCSPRRHRRPPQADAPVPPQTNGKAERLNATLLAEWAYVRRYDTNQARLEALPAFIAYYNEQRPHGYSADS